MRFASDFFFGKNAAQLVKAGSPKPLFRAIVIISLIGYTVEYIGFESKDLIPINLVLNISLQGYHVIERQKVIREALASQSHH